MQQDTNITQEHQAIFNALRDPDYKNFALYSCFIDGVPTSAIVCVNEDDDGSILIKPLFVAVTDSMTLTNHDGEKTSD